MGIDIKTEKSSEGKKHTEWIVRISTAPKKILGEYEKSDICKYVLDVFGRLKRDLPVNRDGETGNIDKAMKGIFANEEGIVFDPNGKRKSPDAILRGKPMEFKASMCGYFAFNDSSIDKETIYVFVLKNKKKNEKIFIIEGKNFPIDSDLVLYKQTIEKVKVEHQQKWLDNDLYYSYTRPNNFVKTKFMENLPNISYYSYDEHVLWVPRENH